VSGAERIKRHRAKQLAEGLTQVNIVVPLHVAAEFQLAAERCRDDRALTLARLVNTRSGKLEGLKKAR
jgi:hypothetical protein